MWCEPSPSRAISVIVKFANLRLKLYWEVNSTKSKLLVVPQFRDLLDFPPAAQHSSAQPSWDTDTCDIIIISPILAILCPRLIRRRERSFMTTLIFVESLLNPSSYDTKKDGQITLFQPFMFISDYSSAPHPCYSAQCHYSDTLPSSRDIWPPPHHAALW